MENNKLKMVQIEVPEGSLIVPQDMKVKWAVNTLVEALKEDEGYYESWKANIAMSIVDERDSHPDPSTIHRVKLANKCADRFLKLLMSQ